MRVPLHVVWWTHSTAANNGRRSYHLVPSGKVAVCCQQCPELINHFCVHKKRRRLGGFCLQAEAEKMMLSDPSKHNYSVKRSPFGLLYG